MKAEILFYKDRKGQIPVFDFLNRLSLSNGKDARINLKKVSSYINFLSEVGLSGGEPI